MVKRREHISNDQTEKEDAARDQGGTFVHSRVTQAREPGECEKNKCGEEIEQGYAFRGNRAGEAVEARGS
ncbi:MAG: hypothetical protein N2595_01860 [bacterium]|nr:hypothetical protein [bacterium]